MCCFTPSASIPSPSDTHTQPLEVWSWQVRVLHVLLHGLGHQCPILHLCAAAPGLVHAFMGLDVLLWVLCLSGKLSPCPAQISGGLVPGALLSIILHPPEGVHQCPICSTCAQLVMPWSLGPTALQCCLIWARTHDCKLQMHHLCTAAGWPDLS